MEASAPTFNAYADARAIFRAIYANPQLLAEYVESVREKLATAGFYGTQLFPPDDPKMKRLLESLGRHGMITGVPTWQELLRLLSDLKSYACVRSGLERECCSR